MITREDRKGCRFRTHRAGPEFDCHIHQFFQTFHLFCAQEEVRNRTLQPRLCCPLGMDPFPSHGSLPSFLGYPLSKTESFGFHLSSRVL